MFDPNDPHGAERVARLGAPLGEARAAMILVHGRGDSADSILDLARLFVRPGVAFLAPQAHGNQWYPNRFMAPIATNEPGITSGHRRIASLLDELARAGIPSERVVLLGFSQGACLTLEFVARHARRYGGVAGLSGGLIGPDGTPRDYTGSLDNTPVFLGCSNVDSHIPEARVHETGDVFRRLGAVVDLRIYPGMGHTVVDEEIEVVREMMTAW